MVVGTLIDTVSDYIKLLEEAGIPSPKAMIYGSFARGDERENSDIDLLVISPLFDESKRSELIDTLWRLTWRVDSRIEPVAVGAREFAENKSSPLIAIARSEGIMVEA